MYILYILKTCTLHTQLESQLLTNHIFALNTLKGSGLSLQILGDLAPARVMIFKDLSDGVRSTDTTESPFVSWRS